MSEKSTKNFMHGNTMLQCAVLRERHFQTKPLNMNIWGDGPEAWRGFIKSCLFVCVCVCVCLGDHLFDA